jgi:hypothetical protein
VGDAGLRPRINARVGSVIVKSEGWDRRTTFMRLQPCPEEQDDRLRTRMIRYSLLTWKDPKQGP